MVLVDKQVLEYENLIENYDPSFQDCISYDLHINEIIDHGDKYELKPGEYVIIKTVEKINLPSTLMGIIIEKNSLIRLGLEVKGPIYKPGHSTYIFLRVHNISNKKITIDKDFNIASIMFNRLEERPFTTYDEQENASYNNEVFYREYGNYKDEYNDRLS